MLILFAVLNFIASLYVMIMLNSTLENVCSNQQIRRHVTHEFVNGKIRRINSLTVKRCGTDHDI